MEGWGRLCVNSTQGDAGGGGGGGGGGGRFPECAGKTTFQLQVTDKFLPHLEPESSWALLCDKMSAALLVATNNNKNPEPKVVLLVVTTTLLIMMMMMMMLRT